jgi:hypothetical protein
LAPVIFGVAIGASALTLLGFWAYEQRHDPRRRWPAAALAGAGVGLYVFWVWAALVVPRIVTFTERTVVSEAWTGPDLTIAVLAAPQFGPGGLDTEGVQRLITQINARDPDVVVVMGDLSAPNLAQASMEDRFAVTLSLGALARLEPDLGVVAVLGPHDAAYGRDTLSRDLEDAGVALLWNRSVVVERAGAPFAIAGWAPADAADPGIAREAAPADLPLIAVGVQPEGFQEDQAAAVTLIASPRCVGMFGCSRPTGVTGPLVGLGGLEGGGLTPPTILMLTLRAENPS